MEKKNSEVVSVRADSKLFANRKVSFKFMCYCATESVYNIDTNKRTIKKNFSAWARDIGPKEEEQKNRKKASASFNVLLEEGVYDLEEKNTIVVVDPSKFFVKFKNKDSVRQMYKLLSEEALRIYLYLANQYDQRVGAPPLKRFTFSCEKLGIEALGYSQKSKNSFYKRDTEGGETFIKDILHFLVSNGLITYTIIKSGKGKYYRLDYVRKTMAIKDYISEKEAQLDLEYGIEEEYHGDLNNVEDGEEICQVGLLPTAEELRQRLELTESPFKFLSEAEQQIFKEYYGEPKLDNAGYLLE